MNFATVCSGIGAPEVAWLPFGWKSLFVSEIEPFPNAVLKYYYPEVPNLGDMTKYKEWSDYDLTDGVICAGTPCQAFSVAGLRKGLDDPRGNLTLVFLGVLRRYRPRWMVWENVPGVLSDKTGAFGAFLGGLGQLGYGFAYRILDAQYFGVPQRRRRVFVVGYFGIWQRAAAVLFERHSLQGYPAPSRKKGQGFAADVAPSLTGSGRGVERTGERRGQDPVIAHTTGAGYWKEGFGTLRARPQDSHENIVMAHGQGNAEIVRDGSPSLTCNHEQPIVFQAGNTKQNGCGFSEGPAYTLDGTVQSVAGPNMRVRRLTPEECESLQGFPRGYTKIAFRGNPAADGPRYKALGNSMATVVPKWIGQRIAMVEAIQ